MALKRAKRFIATFGLIFTISGFICLVVAFATPHWLQRFPHKRMSRVFVRMGLWEACFNDWTYYKDYLSKRYNGCWWIFHFEYRPVWGWLNPRKSVHVCQCCVETTSLFIFRFLFPSHLTVLSSLMPQLGIRK